MRAATPLLTWRGGELRRHRELLHWLAEPARAFTTPLDWSLELPLSLPGGVLRAQRARGLGLRASLAQGPLSVRPRQGGETIRPAGRAHAVAVKRLLQEAGIPPWRRAQLPLIWADERLVAVADLVVAAEAAAGPDEEGLVLVYERG